MNSLFVTSWVRFCKCMITPVFLTLFLYSSVKVLSAFTCCSDNQVSFHQLLTIHITTHHLILS